MDIVDKNEKFIDGLITSFLSGGMTDVHEEKELRSWLDISDSNRKYFADKCEIWFSSMTADERKIYDSAKAYSKFTLKRIGMGKKKAERRTGYLHAVRIAAVSVASAACMAFIAGLFLSKGHSDEAVLVAEVVVKSPVGSRTALELPDGSSVWLNSGSSITYSPAFGKNGREVKLSGEAYFDVRHDDRMPFVVQAGDLTVRDLGTSFTVRNYEDDNDVAVALLEGAVEFSFGDSPVTGLLPGDLATVGKEDKTAILVKGGAEEAAAWKDGIYVFDNEPLASIVKKIERGFGVSIDVKDKELEKMLFNGYFDSKDDSANEMLLTLSSTGKFNFIEKGREYVIF